MAGDPLKTRYVFLVGDGMGDYPMPELGGKTPLEAAHTPNMDRISGCRIGRVRTIPQGMDPGSDVANLSLLGYDPTMYHSGRGPFEAASMGLKLAPEDVAFRMNLVTLAVKSSKDIRMISHSSGRHLHPRGKAPGGGSEKGHGRASIKDVSRGGLPAYPGLEGRACGGPHSSPP